MYVNDNMRYPSQYLTHAYPGVHFLQTQQVFHLKFALNKTITIRCILHVNKGKYLDYLSIIVTNVINHNERENHKLSACETYLRKSLAILNGINAKSDTVIIRSLNLAMDISITIKC